MFVSSPSSVVVVDLVEDPADATGAALTGSSPVTLTLHMAGDPRRAKVEAFVGGIYARRYGAKVRHFAPLLVGLRQNGELLAAAGYRSAADEVLFLERYLDAPVESLIGHHSRVAVRRNGIVEVGHLTAARGGEGRRLLQLLALHLSGQGFEWVVGTVTRELRAMLVRIGAAPLDLGHARAAMLGDEAIDWGSYYAHEPRVLAVHLEGALRRVASGRSRMSEVGR